MEDSGRTCSECGFTIFLARQIADKKHKWGYQRFLKRTTLRHRIILKMIASWLGVLSGLLNRIQLSFTLYLHHRRILVCISGSS